MPLLFRVLPAWLLVLAGIASMAQGAEQFRFTYVPLAVGDEASETTHVALDLKTVLSQDGEVINMTEQAVERNEHAVAQRLAPAEGESAKARITYETSEQTTSERGGGTHGDERPVSGKTYIVARQGKALAITDEQGQVPSDKERLIVARTAENLGRPNPLGAFLNGRTVVVGQTVRLPQEFTEKLLSGWDESLAKIPVDVILMGTQRVDGQRCALFHTLPQGLAVSDGSGAKSPDRVAPRTPIQGKFLIEIETCRVAQVEIDGPVATAEKRGQEGQQFDVRRKGKLQVAMHVEHRRAQ